MNRLPLKHLASAAYSRVRFSEKGTVEMDIIGILTSNAAVLSILGAAVTFGWSIIQFILTRRKDQQAREFETYHRLIRELVAPDPDTKELWLDRQIAIVFELRHFPRYYEVTMRILGGLQEKWQSDPESKWPRLINEVDLTVTYIQKRDPKLSFNADVRQERPRTG